ncbi:hypothetical protein [Planctomycetes bacterium TBK1r]|uniref:ABM domain-containing protein n=1 Tax=Stieleria magnilauensis TaxID=2527963 RepID=A0ABX5Y265_9BACT|nr:hypothetical protein TBK1r_59950 [Planctomycetes bacterium TBK1r]QDV87046.1 hypothetical protein TBK1r_60730 [Planctomycetes bacterium TBK1r]
MSEWITDRLPTAEDADADQYVLWLRNGAWLPIYWEEVSMGDTWTRFPPVPPEPPEPDTSLAASCDRLEEWRWDRTNSYPGDQFPSLLESDLDRIIEAARKWDAHERCDQVPVDAYDTPEPAPDPGPHHNLCDIADAEQSWDGSEWVDPHGELAWHRRLVAGDGWRFLQNGEVVQKGDDLYLDGLDIWTTSSDIGHTHDTNQLIRRRRIAPAPDHVADVLVVPRKRKPLAPDGERREWISIDIDGNVERHATEEEARAATETYVDEARDAASDNGWDECVTNICYGCIMGDVREIEGSRRPVDPEKDTAVVGCDYVVDYGLHAPLAPGVPDGERREWLASIWTDINGEQAHLYSDAENAPSWAKSSLVRIREVLPTDPTPDEVEQLRRERDELRERCKEVVSTGRAGFVVSESCGSAKHYVVTAKFTTLEESQAFYRSLHGLARAVEANELRGEESTNES